MIRPGRSLRHQVLSCSVTAALLAVAGLLCWSFWGERPGVLYAAAVCTWGVLAVLLTVASVAPFASFFHDSRGPGRLLAVGAACTCLLAAVVSAVLFRGSLPLVFAFLIVAVGFLGLLLPGRFLGSDAPAPAEGGAVER